MTPRFPLTAKILIWFSGNLLLLMIVAWLGLRFATRSGFDSFLARHVGGRVEATARAIFGELESKPRGEWNGVLARYGEAHGVKFILLGEELQTLAGEEVDLPETLRTQLPRPPRGGEGSGPNRRGSPPGELSGTGEIGQGFPPPGKKGPGGMKGPPVESDWTEVPAPGAKGGAKQEPPGSAPIHRRFLVQSENPRAYWVGLMGALRPGTGGAGHLRCTLLARSATFSAGGFFFDYRPWVLACAAVAVLSALFWLPLVRGITQSIAQLTRATRQIADGQFDVRVDETRPDELGQLGASINRMTARLERFVTGQKRSLGDIAHERCSPLARLQMSVGILEQHATPEQKDSIEDLREEVQHMSDLVNELLSISKASLKPGNVKRERVNVKTVADHAAEREAANKGEVIVEVPADLTCFARPELLQRALSNLVRNALRYAGEFGPITITARRDGTNCVILVTDLGPGVPTEHLDRIFDAFYRTDPDRARNTGGAGLGLAIVKTCIEACGGTATAKNREPKGLEVRLTLPVQ
ncbi:MAG: sensor histidine kinase [Limisphaerales bacterium]